MKTRTGDWDQQGSVIMKSGTQEKGDICEENHRLNWKYCAGICT